MSDLLLASIEQRLVRLETKVDALLVSEARVTERLRLRSGLWGALGGFLPAVGALVYWFVGA